MPTKVLFVGGGSLGHIVPSVAVWEALQKIDQSAQAHFVCLPAPLETEFLQAEQLPYSTITAPRFGLSFLWKFWKAVRQSNAILDAVQPDVIFSKGGYVSVPLCYAAKKKDIPIVLHESDAVTGRANAILEKIATASCTGSLVRERVTQGSAAEGYKITGLQPHKPIMLVIGGSQGAQAINNAVLEQKEALLQQFQILHITGKGKQVPLQHAGYYSTELAHAELPHLYAITTVAVSRASAGITAELAANGIPTIVVPLRGVGHDHQQKNAEALSKDPLFTVLQQSELSDKLSVTIQKMSNISDQSASGTKAPPSRAIEIAKIIRKVLDSKQRHD